jgi:anti-sigma regulatory factor (Ser/Thr protein kinase)
LADDDALVLVCNEPNNALLVDALGAHAERIIIPERSRIYQHAPLAIDSYRRLIERLLGDGAGRVRLVGEVDFGDSPATWAEWSRFEAIVNVTLAPYPYWNVCAYDTRTLPEPILAAGLATHPNLLTPTGRTSNDHYQEPAALLRRWAADDPDPLEDPIGASVPALAFALTHTTQLSALRDNVRAVLTRAEVPQLTRSDFVAAVSEIAGNGIVHGRPPVQVRLWVSSEQLMATVTDQGDGIDDPLAGYVLAPSDDPTTAGRGLWLARLLCHQVQMSSTPEGFTVRLTTTSPDPDVGALESTARARAGADAATRRAATARARATQALRRLEQLEAKAEALERRQAARTRSQRADGKVSSQHRDHPPG